MNILRFVFGIYGNATALFLFLSPLFGNQDSASLFKNDDPTCIEIWNLVIHVKTSHMENVFLSSSFAITSLLFKQSVKYRWWLLVAQIWEISAKVAVLLPNRNNEGLEHTGSSMEILVPCANGMGIIPNVLIGVS
ncbi:hypothetical protein C5167_021387 [Papaver somniferum]|uniref:Uncharacterized protein n=1 Tax=Papaver somniferum TaxID=3469 RepID=A0A4Y7IXS4_PAPSO|nr:hypothetical protein C5167_021387 [Papaver somniferum]